MVVALVIVIFSLLLDGLLTNFLPYMVQNLSFFTPMLTLVSLILIYPFFKKQLRKYFIICFVSGIVYDLLYTNLLFFNGLLFLAIGIFTMLFYRYFEVRYFTLVLAIVVMIFLYECLTVSIIFLFQLVPVSFGRLFYKISHSLLLNIIYGELLYGIIQLLPNKYKRLNIN